MFVPQGPEGAQQSIEAQTLAKLREPTAQVVQLIPRDELARMRDVGLGLTTKDIDQLRQQVGNTGQLDKFTEALEHVRKQNGQGPHPDTGHNPFGLAQQSDKMRGDLASLPTGANPFGSSAASPGQMQIDSHRAAQIEKMALDAYLHSEQTRNGAEVLPISRTEIRATLGSLAPHEALVFSKHYVDNVLWKLENNQVPGLNKQDSDLFLQIREMARANPAVAMTLSPEERVRYDQAKPQYDALCLAYTQGNLASFSRTLVGAALNGTDPKAAAEGIASVIVDPKLSQSEKQQKLAELVNSSTEHGLMAIAKEYNALGERRGAVDFYKLASEYIKAYEQDKTDAEKETAKANFTRFAASLTPEEAAKLEFMADQYAKANKLPTIREYAVKLEKFESVGNALTGKREEYRTERTHLMNMLTGFSAERIAGQLYGAMKGTGTEEQRLKNALAWIPKEGSVGESSYTNAQLDLIKIEYLKKFGKADPSALERLSAQIVELSKDVNANPTGLNEAAAKELRNMRKAFDTTLANDIINDTSLSSESQLRKELLAALNNGRDKRGFQPTNFVADVNKIDPSHRVLAASVYYGSEVTQISQQLHGILEATTVTPEKGAYLVHLLEHGSELGRREYLSAEERSTLFLAHDEMYVGTPLKAGMEAKLEGDSKVRALQIYTDGFYASEQADLVFKDVAHLAVVAKGYDTNQDLRDRLEQVDKQLQERHGVTLEAHLMGSNLPAAEKEKLLLFVHLPEAIDLEAELYKDKIDPARVNELVLAHPMLQKAYDALFNPPLVPTLERMAKAGKLDWNVVAVQEAKIEGIAPSTIQNFVSSLESGKGPEEAAKKATTVEAQQKTLVRLAFMSQTASAHELLQSETVDATKLAASIAHPSQVAEYARIFARNLKTDIYEAGLVKKSETDETLVNRLEPGAAARELLKLEGLRGDSIDRLYIALNPKSVSIGSENSPLRNLSAEQAAFVESMYNYAENGRAALRKDSSYVALAAQIEELFVNEKLSYAELVRTSALLAGKDLWTISDNIVKEPLKAKVLTEGLDPQYKLQLAQIYKEKTGEGMLSYIASKKDELSKNFANEDEFLGWFNSVSHELYGAQATDSSLAVDDAFVMLENKDATPEQKALAAQSLKQTFEAAFRADSHLQLVALYDDMFGTKGEPRSAFYSRLDALANSEALNAADYRRIIDLASGNAQLNEPTIQPGGQTQETGR
jgi:hypothetical protein